MQEIKENFIEKVLKLNENRSLKYIILTMGCQLNENDSEKLAGMLTEMGYSETESLLDADLVLFNTCCVRENAEERLFGKLGEIKKLKEQKEIILGIGGCMMQEPVMLEKIKKSYHFVDLVFGTHTLQNLPENATQMDVAKTIVKQSQETDKIMAKKYGERYQGK